MRKSFLISICLLCLTLLWGCPKPPTGAYDHAKRALSMAENSLATKCAKEELAAARLMMQKAETLMKEEKYDKAKVAFDATRKLALKAQEAAELRRAECLKKDQPAISKKKTQQDPPKVVQSNEIPVKDRRLSLKRVHFDFNKAQLTAQAKQILRDNAEYLRKHPGATIQIEGHCDERGTTEYNLALGERRARTVRKFLAALGVKKNRISVISYGDQKPLVAGTNERAYAKNRRAEFRLDR